MLCRSRNFFPPSTDDFLPQQGTERIVVFDPTYILKSSKLTFGLGKFWSGKDSKAKKGLEFGCLRIVNVAERTAYHLEAVQTPSGMQGKLVAYYVNIVMNHISDLVQLSRYLVVDGYFMKKNFITPIV